VSITGGSFNTLDAQFAMGKGIALGESEKQLKTNLAMQLFRTDGYAENANVLRGNMSGRVAYNITDKTDIAFSLRGHSSEWNAPGYISETQFEDDDQRNLQDANGENDGGNKAFYTQRLDLNHSFNDNLRLLVFGYALQQEFTRFAKFGFQPGGQSERFNTRDVYATGASLNGYNELSGISVNWIAGLEFYNEQTQRSRWATEDRVRQSQTQDRVFTIQSVSAYAQGEFDISPYFRPSVGLRYDTYFGSFEANDPGQESIDDQINGLYNVSPKVGVRSTVYEGLDLRASVSNGFSLPNSALKYDADIDLGPIQLWQYEVGATYLPNHWLELDIAGFVLNSSNEIVENPPGSLEFFNAGQTRRTGVESKATLTPLPGLRVAGTFSYTETEITDNPENNLEGKALTGIPQTIGTLDISYVTPSGLGSRYRFRDVGSYFISPDNEASYEGYTVSHLSFFYNFNQQSSRKGRIFLEIQNLFNARYAESVFGSVDARSFAPAPLRNYSLGIRYGF
jgi:outer membrane cobalamin receptor